MRIQLGIIDIHPDSFNNNNKKKIYSTHWETKEENIFKNLDENIKIIYDIIFIFL